MIVAEQGNNLVDSPSEVGYHEENSPRGVWQEEPDGDFWSLPTMAWAKPQFSRGDIDRAGGSLIDDALPFDEEGYEKLNNALEVINNWRSSHSYPLQALKMTLRGRAKKVDSRAIVAQRLKRLSSIGIKLRRNKNMALSQMQDLGGCRAVLESVRNVDKLVKIYEDAIAKNPKVRAQFVRKYDYIAEPKEDGYRSIHLVYKYRSSSRQKRAWNGLRIEIQLRSRLQHAWATAVETVDIFTRQTIKIGGGADTWRRFFVLMGTAIAMMERRPTCPNCPGDPKTLQGELRDLVRQLDVKSALEGWSNALNYLGQTTQNAGVYLLELDTDKDQIFVTGFTDSERAKASDEYLEAERKIRDKPTAQAVLVSVESIQALRGAFPNYFADTRVFISTMNHAVSSSFVSDVDKRVPAPGSPNGERR